MTVDASIADWLKSPALYEAAADAAIAARWGATAVETELVSPLADQAGALVEAARQIGFLSGPLAFDTHLVPGLQRGLLGQVVSITADQLGYGAGADVFVISYDEQPGAEMTILRVLRRL